ncbi:hypothetical protein [Alkalicoccus chagannorensis]|uniref:hypothetical protein n=1 Tax=Alkalicoccus chagannorensis TaxID=427072 RepID=UPI0004047A4A|nr:hypothetical protein [Alkalicoccus chagannorensis]
MKQPKIFYKGEERPVLSMKFLYGELDVIVTEATDTQEGIAIFRGPTHYDEPDSYTLNHWPDLNQLFIEEEELAWSM